MLIVMVQKADGWQLCPPVVSKFIEIEGFKRYLGGRTNNIIGKVSENDSHVSRLDGDEEGDLNIGTSKGRGCFRRH